jgi:hypothetical protein
MEPPTISCCKSPRIVFSALCAKGSTVWHWLWAGGKHARIRIIHSQQIKPLAPLEFLDEGRTVEKTNLLSDANEIIGGIPQHGQTHGAPDVFAC